ncbi:MAG: endonuclease III [Verrucomicrobia bacterium]|nr:endonuclease III [Verrucomicrobiota bacterium]
MPRESKSQRRERLALVIQALKRTYPDAHCELNFTNPLELLIATILSAQCTDKLVNRVTASLFQRYRSAADYASAPIPDLENAIRQLGFFRNKARSIQGCCGTLVERHRGQVPNTMDALVQLDGVGRKTANVVLGNAFNLSEGIVVDTHVSRLANRLGLTRQTDAVKIERDLLALVPKADWTLFSHLLIWHGRRRCAARGPDCPDCELRGLCPSADRTGVKRRIASGRPAAHRPP